MTLKYVGKREYESRLGEFYYNEDEYDRFTKIEEYLTNLGWNITGGVFQWAAVKVEDYDEFKSLMEDYKEAKKLIK